MQDILEHNATGHCPYVQYIGALRWLPTRCVALPHLMVQSSFEACQATASSYQNHSLFCPSLRMSPRALCSYCLRPEKACLCSCVCKVPSQVQLLVLQHPLEVGHAKNTARLLHLCVQGSRLEVGEVFTPADLQQWLHAPWPEQAPQTSRHTVLLYPPTPHDPQLPVIQPPALPAHWLKAPAQLRLVLIDGTWRKSRKMLFLNPALQQLPRLALRDMPQGRYAIRKAHASGQLSSFEAGALALAQLQAWPADAQWLHGLMQSFEAAMQRHQQLQAGAGLHRKEAQH